jgi:hypothetical protein
LLLKFLYEAFTGNKIEVKISSRVRKILILFVVIGWFGYWLVRFIQEIP